MVQETILQVVQLVLAAAFLFHGGTKVFGAPFQKSIFRSLGLSQRLRFAVGVVETTGGLLMLTASTFVYGALLVTPTLAGAVWAHVARERAPHHAAGAVVHFGVAVAVAALYRGATWWP